MVIQSRDQAPPVQPIKQRLRTLLATLGAVLALSVTGCQPPLDTGEWGTLHVLIGTPSSEALTAETVESSLGEFRGLIEGFRELHPGVKVTFTVLHESRLIAEMQRRTAAGLAPDLMLVTAARAVQLDRHKLIGDVTIPPDQLKQLSMEGLARVELVGNRYAGVPVLEEPQIACFNRSRLPNAPATVDELSRIAETTGTTFGLSVDPPQLYWSAGSLGAKDAVLKALARKPLSADDKARITAWLRWLQTLNLQKQVNFLPDTDHLVNQLANQEVDWIPCRCGNIARLKRHLGDNLAVAPLPSGPGGPSSPITRQLVWTFGLNSSPQQQKLANALVRFSINPLSQHALALSTLQVLPSNRLALPDTGSSASMDALLQAQKDGNTGHLFARLMSEKDGRLEKMRDILVSVVFQDLTPEQGTARLIQMEDH
jgi:maltose-binding protein MalE